jgi:hypothetical protein
MDPICKSKRPRSSQECKSGQAAAARNTTSPQRCSMGFQGPYGQNCSGEWGRNCLRQLAATNLEDELMDVQCIVNIIYIVAYNDKPIERGLARPKASPSTNLRTPRTGARTRVRSRRRMPRQDHRSWWSG